MINLNTFKRSRFLSGVRWQLQKNILEQFSFSNPFLKLFWSVFSFSTFSWIISKANEHETPRQNQPFLVVMQYRTEAKVVELFLICYNYDGNLWFESNSPKMKYPEIFMGKLFNTFLVILSAKWTTCTIQMYRSCDTSSHVQTWVWKLWNSVISKRY